MTRTDRTVGRWASLLGVLVALGCLCWLNVGGSIAADEPDLKEQSERAKSANNLKQMALALYSYHDTNGAFPAAAIYSKDGKPLLSWRVAILPFVEEDGLYKEFRLDEPWDSDNNKKLLGRMPKVYAPVRGKAKEDYATFYQVFVGKGAAFEGDRGLKIASFTDGTSNTILIAEAGQAVPWSKPADLVFDPDKPLPKLGGLFEAGFNVAGGDGAVHWIKKDVDEKKLRALVTRNGAEPVDFNQVK